MPDNPSPSNKEDVSRWASGITLGLSGPIADEFNTKPYFNSAEKRSFYASVFNQATAFQIQKHTFFNWRCCIEANDLTPISTGAALVDLVETHLIPKQAAELAKKKGKAKKLWFAKGGGK